MSLIKRLLVPIDFSGSSDAAVDFAIDLGLRYGASLHLLHVVEEPMLIAGYPDGFGMDPVKLRASLTEDATRLLEGVIKRCARVYVSATSEVLYGNPAAVITEVALTRGSDLVVMGTHGRGGFAHFMMGSVAERVVRSAPCPVLTVRAKTTPSSAQPVREEPAIAGR